MMLDGYTVSVARKNIRDALGYGTRALRRGSVELAREWAEYAFGAYAMLKLIDPTLSCGGSVTRFRRCVFNAEIRRG